MSQVRRRLLALTTAGLVLLGALTGCSSDGSDAKDGAKADSGKITQPDPNDAIGVTGTELPKSFPDQVPLPASGELKAVVSGQRDGNGYYSLTYALSGDDLKSAAKDYRGKLEDAGYRIENSSSVGANAASFTAFTAIGPKWYVIVYAGGSGGADAAMSLQVTKQTGASSTTKPG